MRIAAGPVEAFVEAAWTLPQGDGWLGPAERRVLETLRFAKRRGDWRLGRFTAKRAVCAVLARCCDPPPLADIEILAAPDGAPEALHRGAPLPLAISLSHTAGVGFCVVAAAGGSPGCDVESWRGRDGSLVRDYFTDDEAALVDARPVDARALAIALVWSAKESALKALRQGLRRDTRTVVVRPAGGWDLPGWRPLEVDCRVTGRAFRGAWREAGGRVFTFVSG